MVQWRPSAQRLPTWVFDCRQSVQLLDALLANLGKDRGSNVILVTCIKLSKYTASELLTHAMVVTLMYTNDEAELATALATPIFDTLRFP